MRLEKIQNLIRSRGWKYTYSEIDGLGNLNFEYKGLRYRVWEFYEGEYGAESNVRSTGRPDDYFGDYENTILSILEQWP